MSLRAVSFRLPPELIEGMDRVRGDVPRTRWLIRAIEEALDGQGGSKAVPAGDVGGSGGVRAPGRVLGDGSPAGSEAVEAVEAVKPTTALERTPDAAGAPLSPRVQAEKSRPASPRMPSSTTPITKGRT